MHLRSRSFSNGACRTLEYCLVWLPFITNVLMPEQVLPLLEPYLAPLKPAEAAAAPAAAPVLDASKDRHGGSDDEDRADEEGEAASREAFNKIRAEAEGAARRERQARLQVWDPLSLSAMSLLCDPWIAGLENCCSGAYRNFFGFSCCSINNKHSNFFFYIFGFGFGHCMLLCMSSGCPCARRAWRRCSRARRRCWAAWPAARTRCWPLRLIRQPTAAAGAGTCTTASGSRGTSSARGGRCGWTRCCPW